MKTTPPCEEHQSAHISLTSTANIRIITVRSREIKITKPGHKLVRHRTVLPQGLNTRGCRSPHTLWPLTHTQCEVRRTTTRDKNRPVDTTRLTSEKSGIVTSSRSRGRPPPPAALLRKLATEPQLSCIWPTGGATEQQTR